MRFRIAALAAGAALALLPSRAWPAQQPVQRPTAPALLDGPPAPVPPAVVSRDAEGHVTVRAVHLDERLVLDGRLDEQLYHDTAPFGDFIQQEPREGTPATEKTEVWVAYDEDAIYVGARLWESDSSRRVMSDMRRDSANLYNNDHFAVMLGECRDAVPAAELGDHSWFVYVNVDDADGLHAEVAGRGAEILSRPATKPWGLREFVVRTPDGHRIVFGQPLAV